MDDAETAIWAEICAVQKKLSELKRSLNQSSMSRPIFVLPPDIFLKIFVLLIDHSRFSKDPTQDARHASQVCHQWRAMALASATLWAQNLDCNRNSRALFAKLLDRAGSVPINAVADFHKGNSALYRKAIDNLTAALSRPHHFTSISLVGLPTDLKGPFQQAVGRTESISLTRIQLALDLFQEHNDNVKSLQLLQCGNLRVRSLPTCRNLTELAISGPVTRHLAWQAIGEGLSVGEWLHYVGSLPQLRSLSILKNAIREDASNAGPFSDIELKHLSTLSLAGTAQHRIDKLLRHIDTPGGCSLNLTYEQSRSGTFQVEILNALKQWFGRWPEMSCSNVTNLMYCPEATHFRIHNKPSEGPPPTLSFRILLNNYGSLPTQMVKAMESVISESSTFVLWIAKLCTCSTNPLEGLLQLKLPGVRTLYLAEQGNEQMYPITDVLGMILGPQSLSPIIKKRDEMEMLKTVFPGLRRIRIGGRLTISVD